MRRMISDKAQKYIKDLATNHPDPTASWGGSGTEYTAGNGIDITEGTISVNSDVAMKTDLPRGLHSYGLKIADVIAYYHDGRNDIRWYSQEELIEAGLPILSTTESESSSYTYKDNVISIPKGQGNQVAVHDLYALAGQDGNLRIYTTTSNKTGTKGDEYIIFRNGSREYTAFETRFRDAYETYGMHHTEEVPVEATADNYTQYLIYNAETQEYIAVSSIDPIPAFDPNETYYEPVIITDWNPYTIYAVVASAEGNVSISASTNNSPVNLSQVFVGVANPVKDVRYGNQLKAPTVEGNYVLNCSVNSSSEPTFAFGAQPSIPTTATSTSSVTPSTVQLTFTYSDNTTETITLMTGASVSTTTTLS